MRLTSEALIQRSHIEIQALVDYSASLRVFRVQRVILAVLLGQISHDGARLPQSET